jgi:hypothetical protein
MFSTPQQLSKDVVTSVATNTVSYEAKFTDRDSSQYSVSGLTLPTKKVIDVSHQVDKNGVERHMLKFSRTEVDAYGVPATSQTYIVLVRPPSTAITNAVFKEEVNRLVHFLVANTNAHVDKLLNGEV